MITDDNGGAEKADVSHLKTLPWLFMSWRVQEGSSVPLRTSPYPSVKLRIKTIFAERLLPEKSERRTGFYGDLRMITDDNGGARKSRRLSFETIATCMKMLRILIS